MQHSDILLSSVFWTRCFHLYEVEGAITESSKFLAGIGLLTTVPSTFSPH